MTRDQNPGDSDGRLGFESGPYADSLLDRLIHPFDTVVRERYDRPGDILVEWRDRAWEVDRESIAARGIQLKRDEWLRIELEEGSARERSFREIDLEKVWNCWIVDADGTKRLLHSHDEMSFDEWTRDNPDSLTNQALNPNDTDV